MKKYEVKRHFDRLFFVYYLCSFDAVSHYLSCLFGKTLFSLNALAKERTCNSVGIDTNFHEFVDIVFLNDFQLRDTHRNINKSSIAMQNINHNKSSRLRHSNLKLLKIICKKYTIFFNKKSFWTFFWFNHNLLFTGLLLNFIAAIFRISNRIKEAFFYIPFLNLTFTTLKI